MAIENTILNHLVFDEEYARKVIPFLKEEKGKTIPPQSGGIKSAMTPRITSAEPPHTF